MNRTIVGHCLLVEVRAGVPWAEISAQFSHSLVNDSGGLYPIASLLRRCSVLGAITG